MSDRLGIPGAVDVCNFIVDVFAVGHLIFLCLHAVVKFVCGISVLFIYKTNLIKPTESTAVRLYPSE